MDNLTTDTILKLYRYSDNGESTLGILIVNDEFYGYTLEDEYRKEKVRKETRIPEGIYEVKLQENITPLTEKYRNRFSWFDKHLHLQDVPGFQYVYIHVGNTDRDTDGCILIGKSANNNKYEKGKISQSVLLYERLYLYVYNQLLKEKTVLIDIRDLEGKQYSNIF